MPEQDATVTALVTRPAPDAAAAPPDARADRRGGLDGVRGLTILLVVAGHAAVSFMVTPVGWALQDRSSHLAVDACAWTIRAFAMPTFYWLAGFAARRVLVHHGARGFLAQRARRIGAPLAIALVPCSLALDALWGWGRALATRAAVPVGVPRLRASELPILLGHLWFLYYLLWLSAAALAIAALARAIPRWLPTLAAPAVLSAGALAYLGVVQTDTPLGFVPDLPFLAYMGGFFAWGWIVHARPAALAGYARHAGAAAAAAAGLLAIVLISLARARVGDGAAPAYAIAASALFTLAMVIALVGGGARYLDPPPRLLGLAAAASYTLYILHLPVVVLLQILVADLPGPGGARYALVLGGCLASCLGADAIVRRVAAGRGGRARGPRVGSISRVRAARGPDRSSPRATPAGRWRAPR